MLSNTKLLTKAIQREMTSYITHNCEKWKHSRLDCYKMRVTQQHQRGSTQHGQTMQPTNKQDRKHIESTEHQEKIRWYESPINSVQLWFLHLFLQGPVFLR